MQCRTKINVWYKITLRMVRRVREWNLSGNNIPEMDYVVEVKVYSDECAVQLALLYDL